MPRTKQVKSTPTRSVSKLEELVMPVDMGNVPGKVVHSGGKRKRKSAVRALVTGQINPKDNGIRYIPSLVDLVVPLENNKTKDFRVFILSNPELVIVAGLFLWAVAASFYVAIDLFYFDI